MIVHVNYDILTENAKSYKEYSEELETILNNFTKIGEKIKTSWDSNSVDLYVNVLNNYVAKTKKDMIYMRKYSDILLGIKDDFESKDKEYKDYFNDDSLEGDSYDS